MRFLLLFVTLQLVLFGANLLNVVQQHVVLPWTSFLAKVCAVLLTGFDKTVAAQGKVIWNVTSGFGVSIEPGCNGIEASIVLLSAMVAFPSRWQDKLVGFAAGAATIQMLNVARVVSLYYLGQWDMKLFHFAHAYLWQVFIMLDVVVVWLCWARWTRRLPASSNIARAQGHPAHA
jgi:exosortase H (IPTLxxWG-CTERM-specific)